MALILIVLSNSLMVAGEVNRSSYGLMATVSFVGWLGQTVALLPDTAVSAILTAARDAGAAYGFYLAVVAGLDLGSVA
eukprot:15368-Alexandrium_andersonii.AAC.1